MAEVTSEWMFCLRTCLDNSGLISRTLSKRIRECTMKHYNYMVTIGDEELTNKLLSVRSREEKDIEQLSLASFKSKILSELSLCECLLVTR